MGPIPEGWLKSHRKSWYRNYISLSHYSSRPATFSARHGISHARQITGLDGPSVSASFAHSFPQPEDASDNLSSHCEADSSLGSEEDRAEDSNHINELEAQTTAEESRAVLDEHGGEEEQSLPIGLQRARQEPLSQDRRALSFTTAPTKPRQISSNQLMPPSITGNQATPSFVTAKEFPNQSQKRADPLDREIRDRPETPTSTQPRSSNGMLDRSLNAGSSAHLIPHTSAEPSTAPSPNLQATNPEVSPKDGQEGNHSNTTGLVRFNLDDISKTNSNMTTDRTASRVDGAARQRIWKRMRRGTAHPGEIVKMEKMLVRIDATTHELPPDFDENDSLKIEARTIEKWREYVVVCRESLDDESSFSIQMYKSRVIPAKEQASIDKKTTHDFSLKHRDTKVNLFSSLDKTLVIWMPWKKSQTMMYILRPRSAASSVEWYTFIRNALGWQRSPDLQVSVPDLSITLLLENPFGELEQSMRSAQSAKSDDAAITKTMEAEKAVATRIIQRCLRMLEDNPEWSDVLERWLAKERIGLAWKRYDRLEWVHGANEHRMYGTMAMARTHELELRPKDHYPTHVKVKKEILTEPAPVEGFLIRLTSQKGKVRRLGKMYFKRLYFAVHDQYLCYTRPAKALPPPPPKLDVKDNGKIPSANEIADQTPLIFAVNPYPDNDANGEVDWLQNGTRTSKDRHDQDAYKEAERKINTMLNAEGYINLSHVVRVQNAQRGNSPADANTDKGPDVNFHAEVEDTPRDDGKTDQFDDERTFELVMKNKLVIRLQAYNGATKNEWIHRLRNLVHYWKLRLADDMTMLKAVRGQNLRLLDIDEEMEAYLGQFANKWEVSRSTASPKIFNMCGISCCRAITVCFLTYLTTGSVLPIGRVDGV